MDLKHHKKKTRHNRQIVLFFLTFVKHGRKGRWIVADNPKLLATSTKGLILGILETRASDGKKYPLVGPFQISVADPGNTISVVEGSADQSTPDIFRPNGSGATGTVTVTVLDQSNQLTASIAFDVVAAPPPPPPPADVPDTMTLSLTPEP